MPLQNSVGQPVSVQYTLELNIYWRFLCNIIIYTKLCEDHYWAHISWSYSITNIYMKHILSPRGITLTHSVDVICHIWLITIRRDIKYNYSIRHHSIKCYNTFRHIKRNIFNIKLATLSSRDPDFVNINKFAIISRDWKTIENKRKLTPICIPDKTQLIKRNILLFNTSPCHTLLCFHRCRISWTLNVYWYLQIILFIFVMFTFNYVLCFLDSSNSWNLSQSKSMGLAWT